MIIDAHHHFWSPKRGDYGWLTPQMTKLYRNFGPEDLAPLLERASVDCTIVVQAAPTEAETRFLLDVCKGTKFVRGVIGWTDFAAEDAALSIAGLCSNPLLVGLRPMVQDISDNDWLIRRELDRAFCALVDHALVFDALIMPRHLTRLAIVADRYPELSIVVDHAAKPCIREHELDPWRAHIAAVAAHPNVYCKISGLVTEAAVDWGVDDLKPYFDQLFNVFGSKRLIWGSDWPVVNNASSYENWMSVSQQLMEGLDDESKALIFGGNAASVYLNRG